MLTVDLVLHRAIKDREEEEERRRRERRERSIAAIKNLATLPSAWAEQTTETVARLKERTALVALDRDYQEIVGRGYEMERETLADFLTEFREPGRLGETFDQAEQQGLFPDEQARNQTINRYGSLMLLADHQRQRWGTLDGSAYWGLLRDAEQGASFDDVRAGLEQSDPSYLGWREEQTREEVIADLVRQQTEQFRKLTGQEPDGRQQYEIEQAATAQYFRGTEPLAAEARPGWVKGGIDAIGWVAKKSITPLIPEPVLEKIGEVPGAGPYAERAATWGSIPAVALTAPFAPVATGGMIAGAAALGGTAETLGLPPEAQMALELIGGGVGAIKGPGLVRGLRGAEPLAPLYAERQAALAAERQLPARMAAPEIGEAMVRGGLGRPRPLPAAEAPHLMKAAVPSKAEVAPAVGEAMRAEVAAGAERAVPQSTGAVARLTELIKGAKRVVTRTEVERSEELSRRAGAIAGVQRAAREGKYTPEQAAEIAGKLRAGKLPTHIFEAPSVGLSKEEILSLKRALVDFDYSPYDFPRAASALDDLLAGGIPVRSDLGLLERAFGPELVSATLGKRPLNAKMWENVVEALNIPRALKATADLSATLRQMSVFSVRHPKEVFGNIRVQVRAFFKEEVALEVDEALRVMPEGLYDDGARAGYEAVFQAERGAAAGLVAREEVWISRLLHRVPIVGRVTRGSERAYVTYLNKTRKDIYNTIATKWQSQGKTANDYLELADLINKGSGRGSLRFAGLESTSPLLSAAFFAPRFALSRFQYPLKALPLFCSSPAVRRLAIEQMASFVAAGSTFLGFLKVSGLADVELDPRSSDFGKIRVGKTRLDFWGGWQPMVRYIAQVAVGDRKAASGFIYDAKRLSSLGRFVRGKLSPQAGFAFDLALGQTFVGEEMMPADWGDIGAQAWNRLAPMFVEDMVTAMRGQGLLGGLLGLPGLFGIGVQTYETVYDRLMDARYEAMQSEGITGTWDELTENNPAARAKIDGSPEVVALRAELDKDIKAHGGPPQTMAAMKRREYRALQMEEQGADDRKYGAGTMPVAAWRARTDDRSAATFHRIEGLYNALDIEFEEESYPAGTVANKIQAYYNVKIEDYTDPNTGLIDWDSYRDAQEATIAGPDYEECVGYIHQYWSPLQWEMYEKQKQLEPYFDIPEQIYTQYASQTGEPSYFQYKQRVFADAREEAVRRGLDPEFAARFLRQVAPEWGRIQDDIKRERERYRRQNPQIVALLIELDYKEPSKADVMRYRVSEPQAPAGVGLPGFEMPPVEGLTLPVIGR